MHEIASWMVTTAFADELEVKRLPADRLSRFSIDWHEDARRRSDIDWPIRKDLAVRAHALLEAKIGCALPIQLRMRKRIPVGGGLGGGSSNAAAMLRALDALFDLRLRPQFLEHLGERLGSDVPFLVQGGSAIVEGRGERLARAEQHRTHLVLVFPDAQCPTGAVYGAFDALRTDARVEPARVRALAAAGATADAPFNDLADAACRVSPLLAQVRADVEAFARQAVHVSGSGSTLFLVCDSAVHADVLADAIGEQLGLPAVSTVTSPPPLEEVDGEPRVMEPLYGDDD